MLRCPGEIKEFLPSILTAVRKYIEYDPNYTYDEYVVEFFFALDDGHGTVFSTL